MSDEITINLSDKKAELLYEIMEFLKYVESEEENE